MSAPASSSATLRALDRRAVDHVARRLARQAEPPWLHREVARRMAEKLPFIKLQPQLVLDWWGALGAGADALAAAYPKAKRRAVEAHPAWQLPRSEPARPWWSLRRQAASALHENGVPEGGAQLLWANMMLHAEADPQAVFAKWHRALAVDGFLMFSTLGPDTLRELRELYADLKWPAPMAELVDMHDLGDMLVQGGFSDPVMDQETLLLTWPTPQALLAELRGMGGNAHPRRFTGLRTPRWRERLHAALRERADAQGRLRLRFEVIYGHAFKPMPRARVADQTSISLHDMKAMVRARRQDPEGP